MKEGQSDFLDLMEPDEPETAAPAPTPEPTAPANPEPSQPRNEIGQFAEKPKGEVEKGGKPATPQASEPAPPAGHEEGEFVPKSVVIALRKELQEAKAAKAAQPPAPAQPTSPTPAPKGPEFSPPSQDQFQDRDAYYDARLQNFAMRQSQHFAEQQYGADTVAQAWAAFDAACDADPAVAAYSHTLVNDPHPIGKVVQWHKERQELKQIQEAGGLEKLRELWLAEHQAKAGAQSTAAPPASRPAPPTPPPSLASGGNGAAVEPEEFDEKEEVRSFFEEARKPRKR